MTIADADAKADTKSDARISPLPPREPPRSNEPRFASLSASLLARKGEAEPALEPFAHARVAETARQMAPGERHEVTRKDQFGAPGEAAPAEPRDCPKRRVGASPKRAAVTFRMSIHDFLRLQLASAELERPAQDIILDALKAHLDAAGVESLEDCRCLRAAGEACRTAPAAE